MDKIQPGTSWLAKLCKALGIDPSERPIKRIVIDAAVDDVVMVYIQEYLTENSDGPSVHSIVNEMRADKLPHIVNAESISIDDCGNVSAKGK